MQRVPGNRTHRRVKVDKGVAGRTQESTLESDMTSTHERDEPYLDVRAAPDPQMPFFPLIFFHSQLRSKRLPPLLNVMV